VSKKNHWQEVWSEAHPGTVSWYQETPDLSLRMIEASGIGKDARVIDIGAGASTLVDSLLDRGFKNVAVLDLAEASVRHTRARLGARSEAVTWLTEDVTAFRPEEPVDLWHDRAVMHFLTRKRDRKAYVQALYRSLACEGHAIIATFALDGPKRCSGLPVVRYGPAEMAALLGPEFRILDTVPETHVTPRTVEQRFTYFLLQRKV